MQMEWMQNIATIHLFLFMALGVAFISSILSFFQCNLGMKNVWLSTKLCTCEYMWIYCINTCLYIKWSCMDAKNVSRTTTAIVPFFEQENNKKFQD